MIVTGASQCAFSVIEGAKEPIIDIVEYDEAYGSELWVRANAFMLCVQTLTPPVALPAVAAPIKAEKAYDMTGNNEWASDAVTWLLNRKPAKDFAACERNIKANIPADAIKCFGHGITVSRSKIGSLSIRELKESLK